MKKQILVIGGSYFIGRLFAILTSRDENSDLELHVVNRGTYPLNLANVHEYVCDRHDTAALANMLPTDLVFDAVIDFCGYEPFDISKVFSALSGRIKQYIFFSTSSVYDTSSRDKKIEDDNLMSHTSITTTDDYIIKKIMLEEELKQCSEHENTPFTIFRPAFIYGPFNYAPRESFYVQTVMEGRTVPVATDATACFSMVSAYDIKDAITLVIGDKRAYNEVFNLAAPEDVDQAMFLNNLRTWRDNFKTQEFTIEEVINQNIPIPFPLDEDELYSGEKFAKTFNYSYTPFNQGIEKTFQIFEKVYS